MTPQAKAISTMAWVLRKRWGDSLSDVELVALTTRALERMLVEMESMQAHPDYAEAAKRDGEMIREALAWLAADPSNVVTAALKANAKRTAERTSLRGLEALQALRYKPIADGLRETLIAMGYHGYLPSAAYGVAVYEILTAGGKVEGPHPELPEPR